MTLAKSLSLTEHVNQHAAPSVRGGLTATPDATPYCLTIYITITCIQPVRRCNGTFVTLALPNCLSITVKYFCILIKLRNYGNKLALLSVIVYKCDSELSKATSFSTRDRSSNVMDSANLVLPFPI